MLRMPGSRHLKSGLKRNPTALRLGKLDDELEKPANQSADGKAYQRRFAKLRVEHPSQYDAPTMDPILKKLDAMAGTPKTFSCIQHSHDQSSQGYEQNEGIHDLREQNCQVPVGLVKSGGQ